ncbi:MAG: hypothetical protein ABW215_01950 [Kibdelosporangium sp.]
MGSRRAVVLTVLLSLLVAGAAVGAAGYLRGSPEPAPSPPTPSLQPTSAGCRIEPCEVVASSTVAGTRIDLLADAGRKSARLKIGADRLVESTIAELGATLNPDSLQCEPARLSACMIRGAYNGGTVGEVVVGRSGKWGSANRRYYSSAGYLAVIDINKDGGPEVVTVHSSFYAQVYAIDGEDLGCTRQVARREQLPGWPIVKPATKDLTKPCPQSPS